MDLQGRGLEIGPSHSPIAPKREGFRVDVIDHCDREGLVEKYRDHGVDTGAIEEVDFVWNGTSYAELTGRSRYYDWIIASHVIEHVPNFVGFLNDCAEILRDGGVLSLAIPDKRFCFDKVRPMTSIAQIIDAHLGNHRNHTAGRVAEYFLNVVKLGDAISWDSSVPDAAERVEFLHGVPDARMGMRTIIEQDAYLDIHAWCFTPSSFRLAIEDLFQLGLTPLRESTFHGTEGNEFFMSLSRDGAGHGKDRMALIREAENEMVASAL
ncbi:MAG TPA: methyltransferase domain-containing protein [Pseudoxanthomonas sp.]